MSAAPSPSASSGSEEDGTTTYTATCLYNDCGEEFTSSVSLRAANKQVGTHVTQAHSLGGITCCGKVYKFYNVWLEHKSGRGHKKRAKAANVTENTVITTTNLQPPSTSSSHPTAPSSSASAASSSRRRRVCKAAIRTQLNAMPAADMLAPDHPILVKIKDQMDEKLITWEELADTLGCSEQEVGNMTSGTQRPSSQQIERLASKVDVKLDWMLYMWHRLARVVPRS